MATSTTTPRLRRPGPLNGDTRFDQRMGELLAHATEIFCDKGYAAASMRDLSRVTGMSLAGLYHYFESKEKLLYLIQKQTFSTILGHIRERLAGIRDPEQRLRAFIHNHLEYFLANQKAMKVLSHEGDVLSGTYGAEVRSIRREYYRMCAGLLEQLRRENGIECSAAETRIAVLSLFGMMNWIYTWHHPRTDANADALSSQMSQIFLHGIMKRKKP